MASPGIARFRAEGYDYGRARALAAELGLSEPVAVTLVRRGHATVEDARRFLAAEEAHDPLAFDGMEAACSLVLSHVGRGERVTVHGDYDVDGVSATAILVSCLRGLGAEVDWLIPDRLADGYGLSLAGVEELARRGTRLLITVDCGIGCAEEVEAAREAGIEVIVTDHHQPPERLPQCPILHPILSGYPFGELCGTGVAHKLATALRRAAGKEDAERDLDLVALATVADMVPLLGENRRLVREGLLAMRNRPRLGLRALMAVSRTDPDSLDAAALSFRLAPRINAAGRLYRADAGVELMLTEDPDRATAIAAELDRANQERRSAEREVLEGAERALAALPAEHAEGPALVLAGAGWHRGVVGIVASRLVERHWRPVVLVGLEDGHGRGSARSVPGFDLIGALEACSSHLTRFGGHTMAAGLELEADGVDAFREALLEHAAGVLGDEPLVRTDRVDAIVGVGTEGIGLELAEELECLAPFGQGNPEPRLLVPSARIRDVTPLGQEGRHSRFRMLSGTGSAVGVAFGVNGGLAGDEQPLDLAVSLELDRWNGAVQPRVILRERYRPTEEGGEEPARGAHGVAECPELGQGWWARLALEAERSPGSLPEMVAEAVSGPRQARELVDRRGGAAIAAIAELISSEGSVLAVCADASRRRLLATQAADPRRFGGEAAMVACCRCPADQLDLVLGAEGGPAEPVAAGLALTDWAALALRPRAVRAYQHVVLVDPPPRAELAAAAGLPLLGPAGTSSFAAGFLHFAWGGAEIGLAKRCLAAEWELRPAIIELWRELDQAGGQAEGDELARLLAGAGPYSRTPELAARCIRVLRELELCEWDQAETPRLAAISSARTDLARSPTYLACIAEHERRLSALVEPAPGIAAAA